MSVSDLVRVALALIDEHGGKLPSTQVSLLYQRNSRFKRIISEHGGLKKFCARSQELEFIETSSRDGESGIQRQGTAQTVVLEALLALMDQNGGQVATSQLPPFYAVHEHVVKAQGGIKKFCGLFAELEFVTSLANSRDRYIRRSDTRLARQIAPVAVSPDSPEDVIRFRELSAELVAAENSAFFAVLKISDIRWSQDCIKTHFANGSALVDVVDELIASPKLLNEIPSMEVLQVGEQWFAVNGNRRLWVLKEYASRSCPDLALQVPVFKGSLKDFRYMLKRRFTTLNNGIRVDVVLEHRLKEYQRFQSMAQALDHRARRSNGTSQSQPSEASASTASGSSSDEGQSS